MIENPIFIVGSERSGSNLLRRLLNNMPGICVPHPPHLMRDLGPLVGRYGDLTVDLNFRTLIRDAIRLVELHFAHWPVVLEEDLAFRQAPRRDLYSVYAALYEQYRRNKGKRRWACKSTFMIEHISQILSHHAHPQFIHLVRDARAVAASARRSVFSNYHPYYVAQRWRREQQLGITASHELSSNTWLTVKYEDLLAQPTQEIQRIADFLHESLGPRPLRSPTAQKHHDPFTTLLKPSEIALMEMVAGPQLQHFNYHLAGSPRSHNVPWSERLRYGISESWLTLASEMQALHHDRKMRERLRKKAFLWSLRFRLPLELTAKPPYP